MIAGGNWWRANEIVIRHLTRRTATRYRCRDRAQAGEFSLVGFPRQRAIAAPVSFVPVLALLDLALRRSHAFVSSSVFIGRRTRGAITG
jgi:hypothetical protein